jgi:hypothetical protein
MKVETKITFEDGMEITQVSENMTEPEIFDLGDCRESDIAEVLEEHVYQIRDKHNAILEEEDYQAFCEKEEANE